MPSDKEIGYCGGETDVRQEWLQLSNSIQQRHSCCSRTGSKLWETEVVWLAQHLLPSLLQQSSFPWKQREGETYSVCVILVG